LSDPGPVVTFHSGEGCPPTLDRSRLAREFASLLAHFPRKVARVDAQLVGDAAMDAAHRRFMDIAGTTDVISFPAHDECAPSAAVEVEVDLIICTDVAAREAAVRGHAIEREILLYAVHGTLHACGFRDDTDESFRAIHAEEDRILAAGGMGAVYAAPAREAAQDPQP
jgi:probable rRNA maturation factor